MNIVKRPVLMIGTASIHVERFVRGLCAAGQPVVLVTHGNLNIDSFPLLLESKDVDLSVLSFSAQKEIRNLILKWNPIAVHAHQANSVGWHAARSVKSKHVPFVLTLWGSDVLLLPSQSFLHKWMVSWTLGKADAWTADAKVLLEAAELLSPKVVQTELIPVGIDRAKNKIPAVREKRILSCRLHKPLYRVDAIIRAFSLLPDVYSNWILEVAAEGPETPALIKLSEELDVVKRVEFTGMLSSDALISSYQRASIFVSVPESDGTSVSLLEAMYYGCLPVVSDLPANKEWITDQANGLMVKSMNSLMEQLIMAIEMIDAEIFPSKGMIFNKRLIEEKAMFDKNIETLVGLYNKFNFETTC